jgi:hypothetical protein
MQPLAQLGRHPVQLVQPGESPATIVTAFRLLTSKLHHQESIIDHFGNYSKFLQQFAAPGHWHDPDMLLIGNACINEDEARTQMAIWVS